jgi:hypothetical protein
LRVATQDDELNLDQAEFDASAAQERSPLGESTEALACLLCQQRVVDRYFRVNDRCVCPRCKERLEHNSEQGAPGAAVRASLFGAAGGVLGSLLYYAVAALTHMELGIIAIVVGILVGKGVRRGAGLHRHWLYPTLGVGITYLAIVSTYIPEVMRALAERTSGGGNPAAAAQALVFACMLPFLMLFELEIWGPIILAIGLWEGFRYARAPKLTWSGPFHAGRDPSPSA